MTTLTKPHLLEVFTLLTQLSETKQKELIAYIRNFVKSEKQKSDNNQDVALISSGTIYLTAQEYKDFINACLFDDWEISEEDLAFARQERRIKAIK